MTPDAAPYKVTAETKEQARALGLYGNLDVRLTRMVKQAMPFGGTLTGLRRFDGYIFKIVAGEVVEMKAFKPDDYDLHNSYQERRNAKRAEKKAAKMLEPLARDLPDEKVDLTAGTLTLVPKTTS